MKVNLNNIRKNAIRDYDTLVSKLNESIIKDKKYAEPNGVGLEINIKGYVLVDANDIQRQLDSLRFAIGALAMTSMQGNEDFKDVYQEVFPDEETMMKSFNQN